MNMLDYVHLLLDRRLHIPHIVLGVPDVEMLSSGEVLLGFVEHLDITDVGVEEGDSHFTTDSVDSVTYQDVGSNRVN